ncbi:MAG: DUF6504 family protein [Patescibacteria group bacterium]
MLEHVQEPINVIVSFSDNTVKPRRFLWRGREYIVLKVTLIHKERKGRDMNYFFSVTDGINFFRLLFSTNTLQWTLEDMYTD